MNAVSRRLRRTRILWIVGVFGLCVFPLGLVWWILKYGVQTLQTVVEGRESEICMARLRKVGVALQTYAVDHDGCFPPAESWIDASWSLGAKKDPENESESIFRCPTISKKRTGEYGYAFFDDLGLKPRSQLVDPKTTPMVFDSDLMSRNAHSGVESLPKVPRHRSGRSNNVLAADGHAKAVAGGDKL